MCKRNNDALFFTCSLIEQLGRSLHMRRGKVAAELGEAGIQTLYRGRCDHGIFTARREF